MSLKTNQERKLMRLVVNDLAINHTDGKAAEPRTQFKAGLYHLTFHSILYLPKSTDAEILLLLLELGSVHIP